MKNFTFFSLFAALILLIYPVSSLACTTILAGKGLTADGSVLHGHNEDMGFTAVGRIVPREATHSEKDTIDVPYETISQPDETYAYWASGNALGATGLGTAKDKQPYDWVLVGMNQRGVTMSCNWMHSKEENLEGKGIRRYAIRQLILERSGTAREAVQLIADLIDKHGQADWGGLDYCLADPDEAWVVETTSKHWIAKKIEDDELLVVANQFVIEDDYDLASDDIIEFAENKGWYDPEKDGDFNFKKAYGRKDRLNTPYDEDREERAYALLSGKEGVITPEDIFSVLMDRYEGTNKFHKPLTDKEHWREVTDTQMIPRPISTNLCQSSTVAQLRSDLPVELGSLMWYAMATPGYSGYFPIYAGANNIPEEFQNVNSAYSSDSAWWTFRVLQKTADAEYERLYPQLRSFWMGRHGSVKANQQSIESKVKKLFDEGKEDEAKDLLSKFTYSQAKDSFHEAQFLLHNARQVTGNISIW